MAATATRNSANPLRMEGTRQSADGRSASEQRHRLGSSATNGPRRKRSMAERLFKKHTIEDQGFVSESDRKSTRLNSSHANISYAVFCLKKKKNEDDKPSSKST